MSDYKKESKDIGSFVGPLPLSTKSWTLPKYLGAASGLNVVTKLHKKLGIKRR